MNMNFEPMLAMFGLGGWEIIMVLMVIFVMAVLPACAVAAIVYLVLRISKFSKSTTQPALVDQATGSMPGLQPVAAVTVVLSHKCSQCGTVLPPDAPEGLCPTCLLQRGFATEGGAPPGSPSFVPPPMDELAKLFPQLEILECLGRGGMGAVYKARQPRLDRFVALKILAPEKQSDPQFAERFEREARVLARLNHPNIVSVFDFGEVQGRFYLLMEFVDGLTLRQVMQAGKISPAEALELVPKICEALQYAHGQGIVHRDIKPENILLDKQGHLKIADFGIAKIAGVEAKGLSLTGARDVMGTPVYMAPEQVEKPQTVDHRADIYSLGVVFYEMLTGELPLGKFAPPSKKVQMDVRLDEVVLHALEKEPERRYQQASQVKTAVETIAGTPPPRGAASAAPQAAGAGNTSDKIILPAALMALFFGVFGAHRFYVGKTGTALVQLGGTAGCVLLLIGCVVPLIGPIFGILMIALLFGLFAWSLIDLILILCKVFTDGRGRRLTNWTHPAPSEAVPVAAAGNPVFNPGIITAPAVALMGAGLWKIMWALFGWLHLVFLGSFLDAMGLGSLSSGGYAMFLLLSGAVILFGGYQMLRRQRYGWVVAAGVLSVMACSLVSPPIGIWALIVLTLDDVKAAFGVNGGVATTPGQPDRFWRRLTVVVACIILIPLVLALTVLAAFIQMNDRSSATAAPSQLTAQELQQAGIHQDVNGEFRKDFSQSFPLEANGRFRIDNVNGRIEIHGWSSNVVALTAAIHGQTGDSVKAVKINIDSQPGRADVHTELPSGAKGFQWNWDWFNHLRGNDATVDYTVHVPQHAQLADVSGVNGHIQIDGVAGNITVSTVNGQTQIGNAAGDLKLSTVNGRIQADLDRLGGGQSVALEAVNGKIELAVPEDADAKFSVTTVKGSITSEFPALQVKKEFPVGNNLHGSLGHGSASVKASAVNGSIKFLKALATAPAPANGAPATTPPSALLAEAPDTNQPTAANPNSGGLSAGENAAVAAAQAWLALIDTGDWSASWKQASTIFQGGVTEPNWANSMTTYRKPLGAVRSRKLKSAQTMTELPGAPDGKYVVMQFDTSFANKKATIETVTFDLETNGQWKSSGYFIK